MDSPITKSSVLVANDKETYLRHTEASSTLDSRKGILEDLVYFCVRGFAKVEFIASARRSFETTGV